MLSELDMFSAIVFLLALDMYTLKRATSAHPQAASFGPERRFRSFEILDVARYASGLKIAQALL